MKRKEHLVTDERIQRAWTALSARFFFVLSAALAVLIVLKWLQVGQWLTILPELIGLAVGTGAAVSFLSAGKAWRGSDEAVAQRRCVCLHASFFYMHWAVFAAVFVMYFLDRPNRLWHLLAMAVVAGVYFARRILAARCGLILYNSGEQKRRSARWFRNASIALGVLCAAIGVVIFLVQGRAGWLPMMAAIAWGLLTGWLFWRYYQWLVRLSERQADMQVEEAEVQDEE